MILPRVTPFPNFLPILINVLRTVGTWTARLLSLARTQKALRHLALDSCSPTGSLWTSHITLQADLHTSPALGLLYLWSLYLPRTHLVSNFLSHENTFCKQLNSVIMSNCPSSAPIRAHTFYTVLLLISLITRALQRQALTCCPSSHSRGTEYRCSLTHDGVTSP